jgi:dihydroorotate dehydrogenase electron transfer subunit
MDIPQIYRIKEIREENPYIKTYIFEGNLGSKPGQFINLWIPRVDEKPFSISYEDKGEFWITVFKVGAFTEKMFKELKVGSKVGIRGPYGKGFEIPDGCKLAVVGGGCGSAPLYFAAYEAKKKGCEIDFIAGARSKDYLFFLDEVKNITGSEVQVATDDGSMGCKGFNVELLKEAVGKKKYDLIITCGPEMMMKKVIEIADEVKVPVQLSMERYMKCGFGICGQCVLDPEGLRVCKDGPVFTGEQIKKVKDFGEYFRDDVGRKVYYRK